jgi:hypothetical protein
MDTCSIYLLPQSLPYNNFQYSNCDYSSFEFNNFVYYQLLHATESNFNIMDKMEHNQTILMDNFSKSF